MKKLLIAVAVLLTGVMAKAQPTSGRITYEAMVKLDLSKAQMRIVVNGQEVKPGDANFPGNLPELPDTRSFEVKTLFAGNYAKEEREGGNNAVMIRQDIGTGSSGEGPAGPTQTTHIEPPFKEKTFLDLANQKVVNVLTVGKDADAKTYRAETPFKKPVDWATSDQTKKIAGFGCHKATVPYKKETYTVWYTTDLPFTYSPVRDLMPEKGVVLMIESNKEVYKATKVDLKATIAEADVSPVATAKVVSNEELKDLREKAMADFRARLMEQNERN